MSVHVLVDDLKGDPDEYYKLVVDAVNKRELPDVSFDWVTELETTRLFFNKGGSARALAVVFKKQQMNVLAYQIGTGFLVSTRTTWLANKEHVQFLHESMMAAFEEIVDRSAREGLVLYLEQQDAPVPAGLSPEAVFFTPSA